MDSSTVFCVLREKEMIDNDGHVNNHEILSNLKKHELSSAGIEQLDHFLTYCNSRVISIGTASDFVSCLTENSEWFGFNPIDPAAFVRKMNLSINHVLDFDDNYMVSLEICFENTNIAYDPEFDIFVSY